MPFTCVGIAERLWVCEISSFLRRINCLATYWGNSKTVQDGKNYGSYLLRSACFSTRIIKMNSHWPVCHYWGKILTFIFFQERLDFDVLFNFSLNRYSVGPPSFQDTIQKEFVFKLSFKNHVYFFRADSEHTYNRWMEVLRSTTQTQDFKNTRGHI